MGRWLHGLSYTISSGVKRCLFIIQVNNSFIIYCINECNITYFIYDAFKANVARSIDLVRYMYESRFTGSYYILRWTRSVLLYFVDKSSYIAPRYLYSNE